jgi:hypothetical protein
MVSGMARCEGTAMKCTRCGKTFGGFVAALTTDLVRPLCAQCETNLAEE